MSYNNTVLQRKCHETHPIFFLSVSLAIRFDGQGSYVFTELDAEKRLALQEEKQNLEQKLLTVPKWQERLASLKEAEQERSQFSRPASPVQQFRTTSTS